MNKVAIFLRVLLVLGLLQSCKEKEVLNEVEKQSLSPGFSMKSGDVTFNGKELAFENTKTFLEYQEKFYQDSAFRSDVKSKFASSMLASQSQNNSFSKKYLFDELTQDYLYVFNREGKVIIGDQLYLLENKVAYSALLQDRELIDNGAYLTNSKKVNKSDFGFVSRKNLPNGRIQQTTAPGSGFIDAPYQYEFQIQAPDPNAGQNRKYVHEVLTHKGFDLNGYKLFRLIIRFKMEKRNGGSWVNADGEVRQVSYRLNTSGWFKYDGQESFFSQLWQNTQNTGYSEDLVIAARSPLTSTLNNLDGEWVFQVDGYISSRLLSSNSNNYYYISGAAPNPATNPYFLW